MISPKQSEALSILLCSVAFVGFLSWTFGMVVPIEEPWWSLGIGYVALFLEMLRQGRWTQAYLVLGSGFCAEMLRFDYTGWDFPNFVKVLLWMFFMAFNLSYVLGWMFADSRMFRTMDSDEYSEVDPIRRSPHY